MDGKEEDRNNRVSGQARDAGLESGQAHTRPPSHSRSTERFCAEMD